MIALFSCADILNLSLTLLARARLRDERSLLIEGEAHLLRDGGFLELPRNRAAIPDRAPRNPRT